MKSMRGAAALAALAVVVVFGCLPAETLAQFGGRGQWRRMMEPTITSEELERYAGVLSLSDDQVAFANDLLVGFQRDHSEVAERIELVFEGAREEFRETRDRRVWEEMGKVLEKLGEEIEGQEKVFFDDFQLVLNEDQLSQWPRIERMRLRISTLDRGGLVSGETVDLTAIAEDAEWTPGVREAASPVLQRYELEMHSALTERNEVYDEGQERATELWMAQDFDTIEELFEDAREAAVRLRDINRKYAAQVERVIEEEEARSAFAVAFKERSFPRVYSDTVVDRGFATVEEMSDLSEDQRSQVGDLKARFARELATVNDGLAKAIEENELERSAMQMFGRQGQPEPVREAREARSDLVERYEGQLRALLTEDQARRLPEREDRDWRRAGGEGEEGERRRDRRRPTDRRSSRAARRTSRVPGSRGRASWFRRTGRPSSRTTVHPQRPRSSSSANSRKTATGLRAPLADGRRAGCRRSYRARPRKRLRRRYPGRTTSYRRRTSAERCPCSKPASGHARRRPGPRRSRSCRTRRFRRRSSGRPARTGRRSRSRTS